MEKLQAKLRRQDLLQGEWARYDFYDRRIPPDVHDVPRLTRWVRRGKQADPSLLRMTRSDLVREEVATADAAFPEEIPVQEMRLPLDYQYRPGEDDDGVTLTVPLEALNQIDPQRIGWLVPGLLREKIEALIRSLPKEYRRLLVPAPDTAAKALEAVRFGEGEIRQTVAAVLSRIAGQPIPSDAFQEDRLPPELRMNVRRGRPGGQDPGPEPRRAIAPPRAGRAGGAELRGVGRPPLDPRRADHLGPGRAAGRSRDPARPA